ncbi:amidohydrolase [Chimaeribacter californicus]|uniref:Amidohydrolase n=2 Tax=Chimaeribacter californicus TaxID=2060067 RepID=A0A2N5DWR5_9GAMM|nr:amidohydrolase [Chimaeribacter californicus]
MSNRRAFIRSAAVTAAAAGSGLLLPGVAGARSAPQPTPVPAPVPPHRIIALEEHFILPEFVDYLAETKQNIRPALFDKVVPILSDFGARRLDVMDSNGVDFAVLSLSGPGVQIEPETARAVRLARLANDRLAEEVAKKPTRYGGFAHLALQDPNAAADELERCVTQLKFQGALVNGETNGVYLDDRRYDIFWERVQALNVPVYLHPGNPPDKSHMYSDHPEMWGPVWSWAVETCSHALRLVFSGVFERFPRAQVILGHMGETLPIQLWRLDSRIAISNTTHTLPHPPSHYLKQNIRLTTSGVCSDSALRCALDAFGTENVMFSIDYPFEDSKTAVAWIKRANLTEAERNAVAYGNAGRILHLA